MRWWRRWRNTRYTDCSGVYVYPAGAPPPEYIEAAQRVMAGSWHQRHASLQSHAPLCTCAVTLTPRSRRASSNKRPIRRRSMLRRNVWLARCPGRLLMTPRGIHQPTRPSHHTTQSNTRPILAAVYMYSRRAASPAIRTETSSPKPATYHIHLSPAPQGTHADAPAFE